MHILSNNSAKLIPATFAACGSKLVEVMPGKEFVNGAGHSVVEEQPEQVNRLIIEFLRQVHATG